MFGSIGPVADAVGELSSTGAVLSGEGCTRFKPAIHQRSLLSRSGNGGVSGAPSCLQRRNGTQKKIGLACAITR